MPERTLNLGSREPIDLSAPPLVKQRGQAVDLSAPLLAKPREPVLLLVSSSTKRKVVDHTLDFSAPSAKKKFLRQFSTPFSRNRELEKGLLDPLPTPVKERKRPVLFSEKRGVVDKCLHSSWFKLPIKSSLASCQIGGALPTPRRVITNLSAPPLVVESLPSTRLRLAGHTITPQFSHNLSTEQFKLIECMQLCIDNEKDSRLPTRFTIEAKGERAPVDGGKNQKDKIHFKLHAQTHGGGRFTEVIFNVQFANPDTNEPIPIASFSPEQKDLEVVHVEHEKTYGIDIGLAAGVPHGGATLKGNKIGVRRYAEEEATAVVNGLRAWSGEESISWQVKAGPNTSKSLPMPVSVEVSIQMTREMKARLWLSCQFKKEGLFNKMSRKTYQPPHQGSHPSHPMEILVGMTDSPKNSDDLPILVPGALDYDNQPGPEAGLEVYHWHYAFIALGIYAYFTYFH